MGVGPPAGLVMASFIDTGTGIYGRNDLDMLEVGNTNQGTPPGNLTYDEAKSHFIAWALLKSPLLVGCDVMPASQETIKLITAIKFVAQEYCQSLRWLRQITRNSSFLHVIGVIDRTVPLSASFRGADVLTVLKIELASM
ncbi:hypothetical protein B0H67DRAFT_558583 [Lasiosphaeris hirsuta]|uniref:alpha-galactosidase n=1 Tax=Lasiosphaeris hirsuta TaxID=260670 RepID=A0AA39ZRI7_9PEZI|nr:hypothetical protein B0H67DRAFT_558583 [Lasiosphaeris hirsuta]